MNPAYRTAVFQCAIGIQDIQHPCFAIVTACNPNDRVCSDAENRLADDAMVEELDRMGWWRFRVIGGSPDFCHQEPGWGVATGSMTEAYCPHHDHASAVTRCFRELVKIGRIFYQQHPSLQ